MNVSLTPELEQFVNGKVESGGYNSASEVVREALRLLEEHDKSRAARLADFNQELGRRLASLDSGRHVDPPTRSTGSGGNPHSAENRKRERVSSQRRR